MILGILLGIFGTLLLCIFGYGWFMDHNQPHFLCLLGKHKPMTEADQTWCERCGKDLL